MSYKDPCFICGEQPGVHSMLIVWEENGDWRQAKPDDEVDRLDEIFLCQNCWEG